MNVKMVLLNLINNQSNFDSLTNLYLEISLKLTMFYLSFITKM